MDCTGLNVYHALADDGCGSNGGHALFTDFNQPRPAGFGETRFVINIYSYLSTMLFFLYCLCSYSAYRK